MAMGIRFAGSQDREAAASIRHYITYFITIKKSAPEPGSPNPAFVNKEILETCIASACMAMSVVLAGSGDLDALRLFRGEIFVYIRLHGVCILL